MLPLHGVGSRQDLPLPFWLVLLGAGATLALTFLMLTRAWPTPRLAEPRGADLPRLTKLVDSKPWRWSLKALAIGITGLAGLALVAGQDRIDNPVFGFVFVWVWVGLVPISLLFGQAWRTANPIRSLLRLASVPTGAPVRSWYPAAAALATFSFVELVQPDRTTLPILRAWVGVWLVWLLAGAFFRGLNWVGAADPFEVYASTLARFSPWARSSRGTLRLTNPLRNLGTWSPPAGTALVCLVLLGGTAFDSLSGSIWWVSWVQASNLPAPLLGTVGLVGCIGVVTGLYLAGVAPLRATSDPLWRTADRYSPGLVPIVAGYAIAHYATMLWLEGQRTAMEFSDPLGRGWDLFGTAELGVNTALLQAPMLIAVAQVVVIVAAHVCGVILTHDLALHPSLERPSGAPLGRQVGLLAAMVIFTLGGLVLLFG